jgi:hypothetical protein
MNCHPDRSEVEWRDLLFLSGYSPFNRESINRLCDRTSESE